MSEEFFSRDFRGRRRQREQETHLPPGQYLVDGFPVLSAGPTPCTRKDRTLRTEGRLKMDELRLDGNAVVGLLGEIFPFEMTTAQVT
jgi:hypothetical protein